jgi:hypothetical protein
MFIIFFNQILIMGKTHGGCEWPVTYLGEMKCLYKSLVGKPEGKRPLERPDIDGRIILMVLKDVACLFKGWIDTTKDWGWWQFL